MRTNYLRSILLGAVLTTAIAGSAAAELKDQQVPKDQKEIVQQHESVKQTRLTIKKLAHGIDLWHDANLKGDFDKILKFEKKIREIIRADIKQAVDVVSESEWQYELELRKARAGDSNEAVSHKDAKEQGHNSVDLKSSKKLIKAKEVLFVSLRRSQAFSNKYRLLNDYLDLLKRELGIERIELADDFNNWDIE